MTDLSAKTAEMLYTDKNIAGFSEQDNFARIVKFILERYPEATTDEIVRGFRISIEVLNQEEAEAIAEGRW